MERAGSWCTWKQITLVVVVVVGIKKQGVYFKEVIWEKGGG
jgi:hypothetical protein